jgi:hypothetical protein
MTIKPQILSSGHMFSLFGSSINPEMLSGGGGCDSWNTSETELKDLVLNPSNREDSVSINQWAEKQHPRQCELWQADQGLHGRSPRLCGFDSW